MTTTGSDEPDPGLLRRLAEAEEPRANAGRIVALRNSPDVTEVLLIRHAQMPASNNSLDDRSLTETGMLQAKTLAAYLEKRMPVSAVYTSPLKRTRETAEPIADAHGLPLQVLDGLREVESYIPGGVTLQEYLGREKYEQMQQVMLRERRWDARGDLYESSQSLRTRAVEAVDSVVRLHPGKRVALVTHGPVINAYLASILQSPFDFLFQPRLTSITVVLARDGVRTLLVANSTPHFNTL